MNILPRFWKPTADGSAISPKESEQELQRRLQTGHQQEVRRIQRAKYAETLGLDPEEFAKPWPGNTIINKTTSGWLPGLLMGATMLAGGAGVGAFLMSQTKPATEKVTEKVKTEVQEWDSKVRMEIEEPKGD